ncbi:amidase [Paramagnetospirillum marisnigri]|uniref:Amidase n=1 Tax=Paramagnetospirillum marisnigri TaxID=1285242 RepID=A0A178M9M1_9PROT|nr:amidase [Paramagnetospirillum marisnigri]OAN44735.1 amidase [Paramagnetospirillum marisnigri]
MHDPLNAFALGGDVYIDGAKTGPLAGLTFAAKDVFDVQGYVTGAGNPDWRRLAEPAKHTAWAVAAMLESGARLVGKTHTDELSKGIFGDNAHYGTPENPRAPGHVPGGSSSGSAAAVAGGLCQLALGTDTAGSTRVPASFCGIWGLRPTLGAISMEATLGQSNTFDTVGLMADDPDHLALMGEVLLRKKVKDVRPAKVVVLEDALEACDAAVVAAFDSVLPRLAEAVAPVTRGTRISPVPLLDWLEHQNAIQGREAWEKYGEWINLNNPRLGFEVADNFLRGSKVSNRTVSAARGFRLRARRWIAEALEGNAVLALPTTPVTAPPLHSPRSVLWEVRSRMVALTAIAGMAGCPQITLPLCTVGGLPLGISLIGPRGGDALLLAAAKRIGKA